VRAQAFSSGMIEYVDEQSSALIRGTRRQFVEHHGNHANADLIYGLAFKRFPESPKVNRVQLKRSFRQFPRRQHGFFIVIKEASKRFRGHAQYRFDQIGP
ncbi:hypothetical protein OA77_29950, partial [Pseudomonas coronafaciens]